MGFRERSTPPSSKTTNQKKRIPLFRLVCEPKNLTKQPTFRQPLQLPDEDLLVTIADHSVADLTSLFHWIRHQLNGPRAKAQSSTQDILTACPPSTRQSYAQEQQRTCGSFYEPVRKQSDAQSTCFRVDRSTKGSLSVVLGPTQRFYLQRSTVRCCAESSTTMESKTFIEHEEALHLDAHKHSAKSI